MIGLVLQPAGEALGLLLLGRLPRFLHWAGLCAHQSPGSHRGGSDRRHTDGARDPQVRQLFDLLDEDRGGTIECDELVHAMRVSKEVVALASKYDALKDLVKEMNLEWSNGGLQACTTDNSNTALIHVVMSEPAFEGYRC